MHTCAFCDGKAQYRDRETGQYICLAHARLQVVARGQRPEGPPLPIRRAEPEDYPRIEELALHFWGETEVACFEREYDVLACPAFVATDSDTIVGVASYAAEEDWQIMMLVMLHVLPDWQGRGAAWALLEATLEQARERGLDCLLTVTTNDDLPALSLYQHFGFHIVEAVLGGVARHHGGEEPGLAGIPVRDEIRLAYAVSDQCAMRLT